VTQTDEKRLADALARLAVRRRDREAWETLYRVMRPFVYSVAYRRLRGSAALAEDATQEVFLRLVRSFPFGRLRKVDALRGYVWRVADNVALTYRRRLLAHPTVPLDDEREEVSAAEHPAGTDWISEVEIKELLNEIWQELSAADRRLLKMLLAGYSIKEVADAFAINYSAAAVRVWRLRAKLRKSLVFNGIDAAASA
jgi:RNA polymerase sigma factor (sigma-70 family)